MHYIIYCTYCLYLLLFMFILCTDLVIQVVKTLSYYMLIQFLLPSRLKLLGTFWCTHPYFVSSLQIEHIDTYRAVDSF